MLWFFTLLFKIIRMLSHHEFFYYFGQSSFKLTAFLLQCINATLIFAVFTVLLYCLLCFTALNGALWEQMFCFPNRAELPLL